MKNIKVPDAGLLAYSEDHLRYELQYLWLCAKELRTATRGSDLTSVFIDCFVIHLRNLIDFFCTPAGAEKCDDDVIAPDFCPAGWQQEFSATLRGAKNRANKALSHLTLGRIKGQVWDTEGLLKEINGIALRFVSEASPSKLSPEVGKWVKMVSQPSITVVGGPLISANSTTTMSTFAGLLPK
jgi:hypothetical protein